MEAPHQDAQIVAKLEETIRQISETIGGLKGQYAQGEPDAKVERKYFAGQLGDRSGARARRLRLFAGPAAGRLRLSLSDTGGAQLLRHEPAPRHDLPRRRIHACAHEQARYSDLVHTSGRAALG